MLEDTIGRPDFLLTSCSADTFRIIYGHERPHRGCFGNLSEALAPYGITADQIAICTGRVGVLPPKSKAGEQVVLKAKMDLLVGMTACPAEMSNNYAFRPIACEVPG